MTETGAIEIPLLLFQLFFMLVGVVGGIRIIDDLQRWRESHADAKDA